MDQRLPPGTLTLPEMAKAKGLNTVVIGKLFHLLEYAEKPIGTFDRIEMYGRPAGWKGPPAAVEFPKVVRRGPPDPAGGSCAAISTGFRVGRLPHPEPPPSTSTCR